VMAVTDGCPPSRQKTAGRAGHPKFWDSSRKGGPPARAANLKRELPRIPFVGGTADPSTPPEAGCARDDNSKESAGCAQDDNSRENAGWARDDNSRVCGLRSG